MTLRVIKWIPDSSPDWKTCEKVFAESKSDVDSEITIPSTNHSTMEIPQLSSKEALITISSLNALSRMPSTEMSAEGGEMSSTVISSYTLVLLPSTPTTESLMVRLVGSGQLMLNDAPELSSNPSPSVSQEYPDSEI